MGLRFLFSQTVAVRALALVAASWPAAERLLPSAAVPGVPWHLAACPSPARCCPGNGTVPGSGAVAAACTVDEGSPDEGSPGEVKPGDLSVRENEGSLPSAQRALKNQGWRPVICYLL